MISAFLQDLRYAIRLLRRSPRDTAIAIAILALGIGANTAMFSAVNHVLRRPFPFRDETRLVRLREMTVDAAGQPHPYNMSSRTLLAIRAQATDVLDGLVGMGAQDMTLFSAGLPERVSVVVQTEGFEDTLDVNPVLGRPLTRDEERRGLDAGVALVSYAFWQSRFGGSPSALGARVRLDDRTLTIVGVMPPQYAFPYDAQFWVPWRPDPADTSHEFAVWGRTRPGVTPAQLRNAMTRVAAALRHDNPALLPTYGLEITTIRENLMGDQQRPLVALAEIVTLMLLIASVNVATLLLARSVARRREFAIRAALGQSRGRHASQLFAESLALASIGCAAGLLLTAWLAPLTAALVPHVLSAQLGLATPRTDWRVAVFAAATTLVSAAIAAVVPLAAMWRTDPQRVLGEGSRSATIGKRHHAWLGSMIVAETALTVVLLAGGGLVIRNFVRLQTHPLGFDANGLLAMELTPPAERYPGADRRAALVRDVVASLSAAPRIVRAAVTSVNPLGGGTWVAPVESEDDARQRPGTIFEVNHRLISPGLFETMGIPLRRGRDFSAFDRAGSPPVVIVSDALARRKWPNVDPIGRRIRLARPNTPWLTVVGIVDNVYDAHDADSPKETWYLPYEQFAGTPAAEHFYLMVRDGGAPLTIVDEVRRAVARVDPALAPYDAVAMDAYFSESIARERVSATLMFGFGAFGLLLASLGVYGVMALTVAQRAPEFGIRVALGASPRDLVPLALSRGLTLVAAGIASGGAVALALNRLINGLLAESGAIDLSMLTIAAALMLLAALAACAVPALAISRLDPVDALRAE
ncbi:MAG TPA: ABC transporter permease [Vicinamibacterales bacterium]|nr:ABC transporter permease [Vicinamibacterales bacterium]